VSIARHYGISTSALLAANDISLKQKKLHKGAMLVIPRGGAAQSYEEADNDTERTVRVKKMVAYRVKRGDTVSKIASHHGVTVAQIKGWNSITKRNPLRVGRTLKIYQQVAVAKASQKKESKQLAMADNQSRKRKTKEQIEGQKYSIKAGESLWTIAKRYNMSVDELVAINGLEAGAKVKAGQKIIVTMAQGRTALDVTEPASTADKEVADTADTDVAGKEPTAKEGSDDGSSDQDNTGKTIAMATASEASPDDIALGKRVPKSSPKVDNAKMSNVVDKEAKKQASKEAKIRETKADTTVRVTKKYTMKKGDSLAVVARKHGVSVPELMKWNQIKNPKAIRAGQVIKIQSMAAKNQPKEPKRETISQKQEARNKKQDVTEQKVREEQPETAENESLTSPVIVNDTKNPDDAATSSTTPQNGVKKEGVPLKLSDTPTPASESSLNYHVKDGDTLWDIARRHKVTIAELQKWNSLSDPSAVKPGDSLTIRRQ
jgi:LysM repeat protein